MAPIDKKRKTGPSNESFVRSKKSLNGDGRPSKRLRPEEKEGHTSISAKISHVPKLSKAREEEAAFPRGGASVLTPLEHKQIQIEATRDVLFEQQSSKSSRVDTDGQGEDNVQLGKRKSKSKSKGRKGKDTAEPDEENVKIEGLSYKRIIPGSLILGQVSQINTHDIALSLPNNLTGYVPITSISNQITQRIEAITTAEEDEDEDEDGENLKSEHIDLEKLFRIGQYLRASVVSTSDDGTNANSGKSKRRIELSLLPHQANGSMGAQNVILHNTIMASVLSVEDHGVVMDLGLSDPEMRGFMSSKEIGHELKIFEIQEGAVILCMVIGLSSNGKIVKLSADTQKVANSKKLNYLTEAPTVDAFLPGTAVEILVSDITPRGIAGKVMGMLDVTADLMHSGTGGKDLEKKYKIGSKIKGRVICTFPATDPPKVGVSMLDHVMSLASQQTIKNGEKYNPLEVLPLSTIIEEVIVRKVEPGAGLFVDIGIKGVAGFIHISRVKDGKIDTLSESTGPYKVGTVHRGRVIGYNSLDGVYLVSLEPSVLQQPFLRIEDLKIGEVVKGTIEKIVVNANGVGGVLVKLAEGIIGLVSETHLADVLLLHPEKIFKEGKIVTARVLSTDPSKRQIRLTLKKSLVNSEAPLFISYEAISVGMQSPGTIVNILPTGAVVQFYSNIRGFLPVYEMSEAFIQDPSQHFRVGQVVNVHVLKVNAGAKKLTVSCKDPSVFGLEQQLALKNLKVGEIVSVLVTEKSGDDISVELQDSGLRALLPIGHLTDSSDSKNRSIFKKIRVGQVLTDLAVLEKIEEKRLVVVTKKSSLIKAAKDRTLLRNFEDAKENKVVHGFVKNLTSGAVFVQFGGGLTGLLPKSKLPEEVIRLPDFGMTKFQSVEAKIISVDQGQRRLVLSMVDACNERATPQEQAMASVGVDHAAINPIDEKIITLNDLTLGKLTKAKVVSVKDTQINVKLADNIQGRIDVSQIFDTWDEIKDRKRPLRTFSTKDNIIDVRVLGVHDARTHRFLPITHRAGKTLVFELSAKKSDQNGTTHNPLTLDKVEVGSSWIGFVNNIRDDCVWVNLSPNVRGRVKTLNLSDDVSLLKDVESNFPVGSALRVRVTAVDISNNRLDLSARSAQTSEALTFQNLSKGMVVAGKVTKVNESNVLVQLNNGISGLVDVTEVADNFDEADLSKYSKYDIVRVCVMDIDTSTKRVTLSTRPSRVLNSSLPVKDREISSISQVKVNDIVRGFVNNISDKGLFVSLGGNVHAFVRISDMSDSYIKDWKSHFQVNQLVKGKVISVDENLSHIQISLKASVIDKNYVPPLTFSDMTIGKVITGKIRKVEDFGVFIVVDASTNVSGLCHQSEMAEKRVHDVKKLYEEGDSVKAIVLKVDPEKKRISFGLKASYFEDEFVSDGDSGGEESDNMRGVKIGESSEEQEESEDEDGGIDLDDIKSIESGDEQGSSDNEMEDFENSTTLALNPGGFDWSANVLDQMDKQSNPDSDNTSDEQPKKKKRKKAEIKIDRTGDLDVNGPQSVSDFERLLLGQPDSADLWNKYMLFQAKLGEINKARDVAERAIKTINVREQTEKLNAWIALLVLEVAHGSDETVEEAFKRACQYNDAQEIHESLASIYIKTGKYEKADELFQILVKKFSQSPKVWENYSHFLHTLHSAPDRARALLPRAIQSLPSSTHLPLTLKFASLEFKSSNGSPERGRTMFEGILSTYPKRLDIWNQLLDLEIQQGDKGIIRELFDRLVKTKGIKEKGALAWFKRWGRWEEENGDTKSQDIVRARAEEWVIAEKIRRADAKE